MDKNAIYYSLDGQWHPLVLAAETPVYPCKVGVFDNLLAAGWLDLHDDSAAYDDSNRLQKITPYYIDREADPVVVYLGEDGFVLQELALASPFTLDLLTPHALLPRGMAEMVIAFGGQAFPEFEQWWDGICQLDGVPPVLAWRTEATSAR